MQISFTILLHLHRYSLYRIIQSMSNVFPHTKHLISEWTVVMHIGSEEYIV